MNVGPILYRELRRQSRQGSTYWLRVLGGGLVLMAAFWALSTALVQTSSGTLMSGRPTDGRGLFWGLNKIMAFLIWLLAPALTADCLAREKREGTLGLLFLTPLRGVDVVLGKAASHSFRALLVVVAAYPVLMLPVLLGGIGWADALRMFLLQLAILGLALAAGITASALTRDWLRARLLALGLTGCASGIFSLVYVGSWTLWSRFHTRQLGVRSGGPAGFWALNGRPHETGWTVFWHSLENWAAGQIYPLRTPEWFWRGGGSPSTPTSLWLALAVLAVCWGLVWLAVEFAALGLVKTWRYDAAPPPQNRVTIALTHDRFAVGWHRRRRSGLLDRNPVAWLHHSRWTARIGKWLWCGWAGTNLSLEIAAFPHPVNESFPDRLTYFLVPLVLAIGFSAAASFRQERETGALEILLVTPLSPRTILAGRLRGLAGTFAPALLLLSATVGLAALGHVSIQEPFTTSQIIEIIAATLSIWTGAAGVAVLGIHFGLRSQNVLTAFLKALAGWYFTPYAVGGSLLIFGRLLHWGIWDGVPRERFPTILGTLEVAFWSPILIGVTLTRLGLFGRAWVLGERALAKRLFLTEPKTVDAA